MANTDLLPATVLRRKAIHPRQVDCALAFDETDHLRYQYFGGIDSIMCT